MKRFSKSIGVLALLAAAATGCTNDQDGARSSAAAQNPPAQVPRLETVVIPAGTTVVASLSTRVSTDASRTGDSFSATTVEPILVDGRTVIPTGARISGVLRDVQASERMTGRARMTLDYVSIVDAEGTTRTITARPISLQAASTTEGDVELIAAGGILGAIIGGIADGTRGAAIGAGAGVGTGVIIMLATKGDDLELNPGQKLFVEMMQSTNVQVLAQR